MMKQKFFFHLKNVYAHMRQEPLRLVFKILGSNSSAMETRLCVVGKENGENKNLMEAIQVCTEKVRFFRCRTVFFEKFIEVFVLLFAPKFIFNLFFTDPRHHCNGNRQC